MKQVIEWTLKRSEIEEILSRVQVPGMEYGVTGVVRAFKEQNLLDHDDALAKAVRWIADDDESFLAQCEIDMSIEFEEPDCVKLFVGCSWTTCGWDIMVCITVFSDMDKAEFIEELNSQLPTYMHI